MDILYLSHHVYFYRNKTEYLKAYSFWPIGSQHAINWNWKGQSLLGLCQGGHTPSASKECFSCHPQVQVTLTFCYLHCTQYLLYIFCFKSEEKKINE